MNIGIGSAFRNSRHRLPAYFDQVAALQRHAGASHTVSVIAAEGDSTDGTREALQHVRVLLDVTHGGPVFGSTEAPARMVALSKICNAIMGAVTDDMDVLVYVENDLNWTPHTIGSLIDMAMRRDEGFDVFAPMPFAGKDFYDVWAFRKNGARFAPFSPYHSELKAGLTEVDSVGSCLVMRAEVARACRIRNDYCLVGWCEDARAQGYRIAVHPGFRVQHV